MVIDRTLSALDGTIINGMTYADGAPGGSTPGKSGFFTTGKESFVSVLGLDMNSMIRDTRAIGSYTMACWIKPGEGTAGGAGFIFGQTNQGIHNGIRNGGVLHTAHWNSDFNATTPLAQDVWVHAVWQPTTVPLTRRLSISTESWTCRRPCRTLRMVAGTC